MDPVDHVREVLAEARRSDQRRVVAISGDRDRCEDTAASILDSIDVPIAETIAITDRERFKCRQIPPASTTSIMGTTVSVIVLDLHPAASPNLIGRAAGAIDGGGLLLVLCPPLQDWPTLRDGFDEGLVVEPFELGDVRGGFKRRLRTCLRTHPGVAIVDADEHRVERDGLTDAGPPQSRGQPRGRPAGARFPHHAYDRCLTADQHGVVKTFERLAGEPVAVVISAERGRGKSSAAGLAAASLAEAGRTVGVTAPDRANVNAFFARLSEVRETDAAAETDGDEVEFADGTIRFLDPLDAVNAADSGSLDVLFVDEAAGLPVRTLERLLACPRVAFTTTRHGYEGSGHGFGTRFREQLATLERPVVERQMGTPIRYAAEDPLETFVNRLLLLDARPAVAESVDEAVVGETNFVRFSAEELENENERLREVMGLLATAHYRTEPDDLARLIDAPNLTVMGLTYRNRVVAIVMLAAEGDLPADRVEDAYRGERLRGNMLPDIFCGVFRDDSLARQPGCRVVRIATHPALRRRGFGSRLVAHIRDELADKVAWVGTGFGATPGVVRFWTANGYVPIAISASRNRASGAHSTILLDREICDPAVVDGLTRTFANRSRDSLTDVHRSVDAAVVATVLAAVPGLREPTFTDGQWRGLVAAADGPGRYEIDPGPARDLVLAGLVNDDESLTPTRKRLLVGKIMQGQPWERVAAATDFDSIAVTKRHVGHALSDLLDTYGPAVVERERERLEGSR